MFSIQAGDVNDALYQCVTYLLREGVEEASRNGPVLAAPTPVCVEFTHPRNRVLYSAARDANPFFHVMEGACWFLEGANDIAFPVYFNKNFGQYSDDGKTLWDCYGWRWRRFFGWDQLDEIIAELKTKPTSRQCVLAMWNAAPTIDAHNDDFYVATHGGKAVPCNTHCYLAIRNGRLNLTVCNRSNDLIFGMLGANAVHMSFLLEYIAMRVGVPMGSYFQFTNNMHVYLDVFSREKLQKIADECDTLGVVPTTGPALEPGFDEDLALFMPWARAVIKQPPPPSLVSIHAPTPPAWSMAFNIPTMKTKFMTDVAVPMFLAWTYRKWGDKHTMWLCLGEIGAPDWARACEEWVARREK
jgi:thymidylate synthase